MRKLTLLLFLVLVLFGCANDNKIYDPPQNLAYNEQTYEVSWSLASDATLYILSINSVIYKTTDLFFDMSSFEPGIYLVKVGAIYGENYSKYSSPIEITILKEVIVDVTLNEGILSFISQTNNIKYKLKSFNYLGQLENTVQLEGTSYQVTSDLGFKHYEVEGMLNGLLVYDKTIYVNLDGKTYFKGEEFINISEIRGDKVYLNGDLLDESAYLLSSEGLSIHKAYLETLGFESYLLKVEGEVVFLTYLCLSETEKPKLFSASEVKYEGNDATFKFQMYGCSLIGIYTTPEITNEDFSFREGILTIKKEFIESIIAAEPARKQIFFQYELLNQELTVIGYFTIRLVD